MKPVRKLKLSLWALVFVSHAASGQIIGLAGTGTTADHMGEAVVAGDFNCDSYDDLAAYGSRNREINIVYGGTGSANKLGTPGNVQFGLGPMIEVLHTLTPRASRWPPAISTATVVMTLPSACRRPPWVQSSAPAR